MKDGDLVVSGFSVGFRKGDYTVYVKGPKATDFHSTILYLCRSRGEYLDSIRNAEGHDNSRIVIRLSDVLEETYSYDDAVATYERLIEESNLRIMSGFLSPVDRIDIARRVALGEALGRDD